MSYRAIFLLAVSVLLATGFARSWLNEPENTLQSWPRFLLVFGGAAVAGWLLVPKGRLNARFSTVAVVVTTSAVILAAVRRPLVLLPYIPFLVAAALAAYILKPRKK